MSHDDSDWICDMFQPSQYHKNKIELQVAKLAHLILFQNRSMLIFQMPGQ